MSSALNKPKYKMIIDNYYNQIANKEESLTSLNTALLLKDLHQHSKSKVADKPIEIISQQEVRSAYGTTKKLEVIVENSHVQIIERHQSLNANPVLTNSVTEIFAQNMLS
jgi:Fe-S cluster assembly protein SufD